MGNQVRNINKVNSGLCPHGLPPGACPICSNMGGGNMRAGERPQKAGEMSYHECVMMGNLLRARALAQKQHEANLKHNLQMAKLFENAMKNLSQKLQNFINLSKPNFIQKPLIFVAQNLVLPILNFIQKIPEFVKNFQNFKFEIQDKLNAIFGEAKAFLEKNVSEKLMLFKEKLKGLFKSFKKHNAEDDDTKIDDDKKIFNLKTIINKIIRKKKDKDGNSKSNK